MIFSKGNTIKSNIRLKQLFNTTGPLLGFVFVILFFSFSNDVRPYFLTFYNFKLIFSQTVIVALASIGMTFIIISGGIDLSVGSVVALTSVIAATLLQYGFNPYTVILITIITGGLVGLVNGSLISYFKMNPFIVTLGMLGIARGLAKMIADNKTVNFPDSPINILMQTPDGWMPPIGVFITLLLFIIFSIISKYTVLGKYVFAIGSNENAALLSGVRVHHIKTGIYFLAGLFFAVSGLMQMARLRQGDPTIAIGLELDVIAAVIIGGASLRGGIGSISGSLIGALIMATLRNGSQQMGWPTYFQEIIIGVVIVLAITIDKFRQKVNPS